MGWLEDIKNIIGYVKDAKDPNIMEHIITLQSHLLELSRDREELKKQLEQAIKEKDELLAKQKQLASIITEHGVYFLLNQEEGQKKGPFCTRCYDCDNKMVLLKIYPGNSAGCPNCNTNFDYLAPPDRYITGTNKPYDPLEY